jgi:plasmid stabilization system protein ParE
VWITRTFVGESFVARAREIVWSPEAVADLEAAVQYLAERNPRAAESLATGVLQLVERLATEPLDGPPHELTSGATVRGWPLPPFRVYYQRTSDVLFVVRMYHQRRDPIAR